MATAELVPAAVETPSSTDVPAAKPANPAKGKSLKERKASTTKKPALHPPYLEMVKEAITSLKERSGSSQYAISKFVEDKHKAHLPANFKKLLLVQLRKLTAAGKLTKLKNSYKISSVKPNTASKSKSAVPKPKSVTAKPKSATGKPKSVTAKPKSATGKPKKNAANVKSAVVKLKKVAAKSKAAPVKLKAKSAAPKPKTVDPKPKAVGRPVKAAKISAKAAPGKKPVKVVAKKPKTVKKAPAAKK